MTEDAESLTTTMGRGVVAGVAGTVAMTAFQRFVEMPLTRRDESFAPAQLVMRLLPLRPATKRGRRRLNNAAHFSLGAGWGAARAAAARFGLDGQRAAAATFAVMYPADVASATMLGVYHPRTWSAKGLAIDLVDKLVQAEATGLAYHRLQRHQRAQ